MTEGNEKHFRYAFAVLLCTMNWQGARLTVHKVFPW